VDPQSAIIPHRDRPQHPGPAIVPFGEAAGCAVTRTRLPGQAGWIEIVTVSVYPTSVK
jgi:hypothetical protein